jgi:hypothetical protein
MPTLNQNNDTETFKIDSRGFLYLKLYREANYNTLTVESLNKYLDTISNVCDKNAKAILVDIRDIFGVVSIDYPCYRLLSKDIRLKNVCQKMAFVTNSLPLQLKINNYITKYNPNVRTRVFKYLNDGVDYCKSA